MVAQANAALYREKQELAMLQSLEKSVEEQVNSKTQEIQLQSKGGINLDYLKEEIAKTGDLQKRVGEKKETLEAEIEAPERVSILDDGFAVQTLDQKSRIFNSESLGGLGTFGLVLLSLAFFEFRSRRVSGLEEIVHGLGLPLIGVLPHVPAHALNRQIQKSQKSHWQQMLAESVNATRAILVHAAKNKSLSVVMVSSALKGEGKTLVSSHLAISMAMAGFKTLLIDADLRCPSLHRLFDLPSSPGLNDLLRDQVDLESVLYSERVPGLSVIPAGHGTMPWSSCWPSSGWGLSLRI